MIEERLEEYMEKVEIKSKELSQYYDEKKGLLYPLPTASLLCRVDYLELTKEELEKAKFELQVEKKEYKMYDCTKIVPKYEITKVEADKNKLIDKQVKATHIWNVKNQTGIFTTFENKEEAVKLAKEINDKVYGIL